jgi:DNA-binding transcriptional regulator GbsR (MarR family)
MAAVPKTPFVMPVSAQPAVEQSAAARARSAALSDVERDVIAHFVEISRALGQPRSFAEIYGLLFISPHPLAMDDLCARLEISKGSVSQGLKFLREIGAVKEVEIEDDRRTHYQAVAELRQLAGRFLRDQIGPRLAGSEDRLKRLASATDRLSTAQREHVTSRVIMLQSWNKNTRRVLPLAIKLLGG